MRKWILITASALAIASPAMASDLPVTGYRESYVRSYEYRTAPRVVVEEAAPVVSETVVVRRPVVVERPPVLVEEEPIYSERRVYAAPPVYAYSGWRAGWGYRHRLREGW
jgi:hypothetical protein